MCALVSDCDGLVVVGWLGRASTTLQCTHHVTHVGSRDTSVSFSFPSLPCPVVGEMPSAARYAAVGMVGRPFSHVVRDVLCERDEGIAEVREQHRYPPSAYAVRECSGNCRGRPSSLSEIMQIVTSAVRAIYFACVHPGVPVVWYTHIRDLSPTAEAVRGAVCPR